MTQGHRGSIPLASKVRSLKMLETISQYKQELFFPFNLASKTIPWLEASILHPINYDVDPKGSFFNFLKQILQTEEALANARRHDLARLDPYTNMLKISRIRRLNVFSAPWHQHLFAPNDEIPPPPIQLPEFLELNLPEDVSRPVFFKLQMWLYSPHLPLVTMLKTKFSKHGYKNLPDESREAKQHPLVYLHVTGVGNPYERTFQVYSLTTRRHGVPALKFTFPQPLRNSIQLGL